MTKQRSKGTGSVYRNSRGQWVAAMEAGWSTAGKRRRRTFKARTRRGALQRLAQAQERLAAEGPATTFTSTTVKSWADQWLGERVRTVRPGTYVADRSAVHRWIIPSLGHIRLEYLTPADIRSLVARQEEAGLAVATMRRTHAVLSKMLTDAVADGYHVGQRAREASGPGQGPATRQALTLEQATAILDVASLRPDRSRWIAALIEGLRPAEALGLTWEMVDLTDRTMTLAWQLKTLPYRRFRDPDSGFRVPRGFEARHLTGAYHLVRPKTRAGSRVIPIVPQLASALRQWRGQARNPHNLVWPHPNGGPCPAEYDRAQWYEIAADAGVQLLMPDGSTRRPLLYEARHTAATLMLANGVDETTIKAVLGHSTILSTQAYLHTDLTRSRAALAASAHALGLGR